jgi:hypothetical protein
MDMIGQTPASPKKNTTWIWIVVAIAVIGLCCLVLLVGAGALAVWKGTITLPGISIPGVNLPSQASPALPTPMTPSQQNPNTTPPTSITVEPYQPQPTDRYPGLQDLASNWQNPTGPGTNTYDISVSASQPVLLFQGWCTSTKAILDQNFQHIQYLVEVDGQPQDVSKLSQANTSAVDKSCRDFAGIIRAWPTGNHTIKISMRLDAKINDGWSDFAAGDYTEIYNITVTQ